MLRTWGRVGQENGIGGSWTEVTTDTDGYNDAVYLTTVIQVLRLSLGESPFFANYGIPAQQSVVTQVFPDFYVAQTQQQFAPYFASIMLSRLQGAPNPIYRGNIVAHNGAILQIQVPT